MFDNIGGKLKSFAEKYFIITVILFMILGFALLIFANEMGFINFITANIVLFVLGPLAAWINSALMYGLGELIENTREIKTKFKTQDTPHNSFEKANIVQNKPHDSFEKANITQNKPHLSLEETEERYMHACKCIEMDTVENYYAAIDLLNTIPSYKDADEKVQYCRQRIAIKHQDAVQKTKEMIANQFTKRF